MKKLPFYIVYDKNTLHIVATFKGAMKALGYAEKYHNLEWLNRTHPKNKELYAKLMALHKE